MPTAEIRKRKGIVTRLVEHKDADLIVTALDENGSFSFYAKGARKMTSRNAASLQLLVESEFLLALPSSQGIPVLKESHPLHAYALLGDFDSCVVANFLLEAMGKMIAEEDLAPLHPWLLGALKAMEEKKDPLTIALHYFAHCLKLSGIGLEVDACVLCGSKQKIAALSYEEGGFVCESCFDPLVHERTPSMALKIARYAFKAPLEDLGRVRLERSEALKAFRSLLDYAQEMTGARFSSCRFLLEQ